MPEGSALVECCLAIFQIVTSDSNHLTINCTFLLSQRLNSARGKHDVCPPTKSQYVTFVMSVKELRKRDFGDFIIWAQTGQFVVVDGVHIHVHNIHL